MKTIETITEEIEDQAQEAFILQCGGGTSWHSLILTGDGEIYWTENIDQHSCSEAVWKGEDKCIMKFQGWCPDEDQAYYDQIEATEEELIEINSEIADYEDPEDAPYEIDVNGETFHRGDKNHGYDATKWYRNGDLVTDNSEMWPSIEDAVETAQRFWAEKEDEEAWNKQK